MNMKYGFSLLEVVIGVLISSILSITLFQSLFQVSKALRYVDGASHMHTDITILDRQLDRDFSGMFLPLKKAPPVREDGDKKDASVPAEQPKKQDPQKPEKEEDKYQPDAFVINLEQTTGTVSMFSCITSNPALMYGNLLPRIVRVVYRLVPDRHQEGLYTLTRQQSDDLDLAVFTDKSSKIRAYTLISGIKQIKIDAWIEKIKKPEKNQQEQKKPGESEKKQTQDGPAKRVFVEWQAWKKTNEDEKKQFELALIPALMKITVIFMQGKREVEQVYWYAPLYDMRPVMIEGPSALLTDKERDGKKQAEQQYGKINEQLQDFNERVLSKKVIPPR